MSIRVAFDVTAQIAGAGGIARYQAALSTALEEAGTTVDRFAFGRASQPVPAGVRHVRTPSRLVFPAWRRLGIPSVSRLAPHARLVHTGAPVLPRTRLPIVATVHDLDAIDHPDLHPRRSVEQLQSLLATLDRAEAIIADSEHVAGVLRERGIAPERLSVVRLGVPALAAPVAPWLDGPYLLAVGQVMPRKGFDVLLKAFALAADGPLAAHHLVIVGPPSEHNDELDRLRGELGLTGRVTFAGAVGDGELAGLYAGASAVCVPSRAEGFGLPVIEAAAAGAPLVCSDLPVLREVSGGHARFAPVGDEVAWAAALAESVAAPEHSQRLAAAGRTWVAGFTWEQAARETIAVYERVVGAVPSPPGAPG